MGTYRFSLLVRGPLFVLCLAAALLIAESEAFGEPVSEELARTAATYYAEQAWPGCELISVTPYYALDDSISAYAVQFAKRAGASRQEQSLAQRLLEGSRVLESVTAERRSVTPKASDKSRADGSAPVVEPEMESQGDASSTVENSAPGDPVRFRLPPGALDRSRGVRHEERTALAIEEHESQLWESRHREALLASTLSLDIGTLIIAARTDLYPVLERMDGAAPHLRDAATVRRVAGISDQLLDPVQRTIYLGPMATLHEVQRADKRSGSQFIDPRNAEVVTPKAKTRSEGARMKASSGLKVKTPSEAVWKSFAEKGTPPPAVRGEEATRGLKDFSDQVPFYLQSQYDKNACGPAAIANIFGYWDRKGYGNLIDCGEAMTSFDEGHEDELVYHLMKTLDYSPDIGVWPSWMGIEWDDVDGGIVKVWLDNAYGNSIFASAGEYQPVRWSVITENIDAGRPLAYCWYLREDEPWSGHWGTIVGYDDRDPGNKLIHLHNNWESNAYGGIWLNWSNQPGDEEWRVWVRPDGEPFSTVWSDDFEAGIAAWDWNSFGSSHSVWSVTDYRANMPARDPAPPGGAVSLSVYCAQSPERAPGPYPPGLDTMLVYGPFSTKGYTRGEIACLFRTIFTDTNGDYFALAASLDGEVFDGHIYHESPSAWFRAAFDLTNVPYSGNLLGKEQVWVALWFHSDDDSNVGEGAYVDDVSIRLWPYRTDNTLNPPTYVSATKGLYADYVTVNWGTSPGATHYRLHRAIEGGRMAPLTGWMERNQFSDTTALSGQRYWYRVEVAASPTGFRKSELSEYFDGWKAAAPPEDVDASYNTSSGGVLISWSPGAANTTHFRVYRANVSSPTSEFLPVSGWITKWNFEDTTAQQGKTYFYRVKGARDASGSYASPFSDYDSGLRALVYPKNVQATDGTSSSEVTVTWTGESGFYFRVYRIDNSQAAPDPISDWIEGNTYHDTTAPVTTTYYYYVKKASGSNGLFESGWSAPDTGWRRMSAPANVTASDGTHANFTRVTWDAVPGAGYYWVWVSLEPNAPLAPASWAQTGTTFDDTIRDPGEPIYYWIQAAKSNGGFRPSDWGGPDLGWRQMPAPTNVQATDGMYHDRVTVTWDQVPGAQTYSVFRSNTGTPSVYYHVAEHLASTSANDVPPAVCANYYYWVIAERGPISSPFSNSDQGSMLQPPPGTLDATDGTESDGINVTWPYVADATHYKLYRSEGTNPDEAISLTPWQSRRNHFDASVSPGAIYRYWVRAAQDAEGSCAGGFSSPDTGWRRLPAPTDVQASDGEHTDKVVVTWFNNEAPVYSHVYRSSTYSGTKSPIGSWVYGTTFEDTAATPGQVYHYWVKCASDSNGTNASDFSASDTGWAAYSKYAQQPNWEDGYDVASWNSPSSYDVQIYDDWLCPDGVEIERVTWWGSYPSYSSSTFDEVEPPSGDLQRHFVLRWYSYVEGTPPQPGTLLGEYHCYSFLEEWAGVIAQPAPQGTLYEHEFRYTADLPDGWQQVAGTRYFVSIQAEFDGGGWPMLEWGWLNSYAQAGTAAQRWINGAFSESLSWAPGHPEQGEPMDMAFQFLSLPLATPTPSPSPSSSASPTPTPAPSPTPDLSSKIEQLPNFQDAQITASWRNNSWEEIVADDWVCPDGQPIHQVTWWGAFSMW